MRIGIYDPYIEILGGGERYVATIAEILSKKAAVEILAPNTEIKRKILYQFGINLKSTAIIDDTLFQKKGILAKLRRLSKYDTFFYVTDGSIFFSSAAKNILIVQSPAHCPKVNLFNNLKLKNWQIICYSEFVARTIKDRLNITSFILPPAIENIKYNNLIKDNIILSVGRFFPYPHNKKQEILIEAFKSYYNNKLKGYTLIIAGALTESGGEEYLKNLKKRASGLPIKFVINPQFSNLKNLYSTAKIYWHAAGFGEDLDKYPERAEHFGITTVEAMQAGCIPVVFNGGGQKEIVKDGKNGFLWDTEHELIEKTLAVLTDSRLQKQMSQHAQIRSRYFSKERFYERLEKIIT